MVLLTALTIAVILNTVGFLIAFKFKSDKLTDLAYGLTFLVIATFLFSRTAQTNTTTTLYIMIAAWAWRLIIYLLIRVFKFKKDRRFDKVRSDFRKFGTFWLMQAITAWIIMLPAMLAFKRPDLQLETVSLLGLLIWAGGFALETTADYQKFVFNLNPAQKGVWIESGVWSYSRHPNFLGEILVWVGVYLYTWPMLSGMARLAGLISPLWISGLLIFISGIPPLEKSADKKWGNQQSYKGYKNRVPVLLPKLK